MKKFFTTRLNRKKFFLYTLPLTIFVFIAILIEILFGGGAIFGMTVIDNMMSIINSLSGSGFAGIFGLFVLLVLPSLIIRRFHDLGMSGWNILLLLIPFINCIIFIILLLRVGEKEANKWDNQ